MLVYLGFINAYNGRLETGNVLSFQALACLCTGNINAKKGEPLFQSPHLTFRAKSINEEKTNLILSDKKTDLKLNNEKIDLT